MLEFNQKAYADVLFNDETTVAAVVCNGSDQLALLWVGIVK